MKDKIGGKEMKEVSNTNKYRRVNLYETRKVKITYTECKFDRSLDRIRFVKLGDQYEDPEIITVYRYEDEQLIEDMLKMYGAE